MNGSSTNSVNPPVWSWTAAIVRRGWTQWCGASTWACITVELDGRPSLGAGFRPALREPGDPGAGVADVGEVAVPVHPVGDVVPDRRLTQLIRNPRKLVQRRPGDSHQRERLRIRQPGRIPLGGGQSRLHLA